MANIHSKKMLMSGGGYKAYLIYNNNNSLQVKDVSTLGFTEKIDVNTTCGIRAKGNSSNYYILNGKLYYYNGSTLTQVGSLSTWTDITGYYDSSGRRAYGIASGSLYYISNSTTIPKITSLANGWTKVSGIYYSGYSYPLAIRNGMLYYVDGTTPNSLGVGNGVTDIGGSVNPIANQYNIAYAYAIIDNTLQLIYYSASGRLLTTSDVTSNPISKMYVPSLFANLGRNDYSRFIFNNGKLYATKYSSPATLTQIGNLSNWTDVSNNIGIAGGSLYYINGTTTIKIGTDTDWESVNGSITDRIGTGFAIKSNKSVYGFTTSNYNLTKIIDKCINIYGEGFSTFPALAICET